VEVDFGIDRNTSRLFGVAVLWLQKEMELFPHLRQCEIESPEIGIGQTGPVLSVAPEVEIVIPGMTGCSSKAVGDESVHIIWIEHRRGERETEDIERQQARVSSQEGRRRPSTRHDTGDGALLGSGAGKAATGGLRGLHENPGDSWIAA